MITLVTGGIKSGKSDHALHLVEKYQRCAFIATADPDDTSMHKKIKLHQEQRTHLPLTTYEEKISLDEVIPKIQGIHDAAIIDCLTMWLSNVMYTIPEKSERKILMEKFISSVSDSKIPLVFITNEVGLGIIPENKLAREYGEELGLLNKKLATVARSVILMVCGIPLTVK